MDTIIIPRVDANSEEVKIVAWLKKEGDVVKKGDVLVTVETSKSVVDIESEFSGHLRKIVAVPQTIVPVLGVVGYIGEENEEIPKEDVSDVSSDDGLRKHLSSRIGGKKPSRLRIAPSAKKLGREHGLDLEDVFKNVSHVVKREHVEAYLERLTDGGDSSKENISFAKRTEIKQLSQGREALYSQAVVEVSVGAVQKKLDELFEKKKLRCSIGEYISHVAARVLPEFPALLSYYTEDGVVSYEDVNVGYAVAVDDDLYVPVVKKANTLEVHEFIGILKNHIMQVFSHTMGPEVMEAGTFTITDLSSFGVRLFTPLINGRQCAILGIGSVFDSVRVIDDTILADKKISLILGFDHRIINANYAAAFLRHISENLSND